MSRQDRTTPDEPLMRLIDELADDVLKTSDEDILAETKETGADPCAAAARVRQVLRSALFQSGKERMRAARASVVYRIRPRKL